MYLLTHTRLRSCQLILSKASSAALTQDKTTQINFLQIREWRLSDARGSAAFWLSVYVLLALFYHKEITFHYPVLNNIAPQKRFRAQTVNTVQHQSVCLITSLVVDQIHKASLCGQLAWTCRQPTRGEKITKNKMCLSRLSWKYYSADRHQDTIWTAMAGDVIKQMHTRSAPPSSVLFCDWSSGFSSIPSAWQVCWVV